MLLERHGWYIHALSAAPDRAEARDHRPRECPGSPGAPRATAGARGGHVVGWAGPVTGGRQSFLAAVSLPLDAAVDCYGAFITGAPPEGMPLKVGPIKHLTKDLSCPLLGLFGADDQYPSPDQVDELEEELKAQGKTYEFHIYDGAGHAFFSVNRTAYRPEAAVDGWEKILTWFGRYLAS